MDRTEEAILCLRVETLTARECKQHEAHLRHVPGAVSVSRALGEGTYGVPGPPPDEHGHLFLFAQDNDHWKCDGEAATGKVPVGLRTVAATVCRSNTAMGPSSRGHQTPHQLETAPPSQTWESGAPSGQERVLGAGVPHCDQQPPGRGATGTLQGGT